MGLDPNKYTRDQLEALAVDLGIDQGAIDDADTKQALVDLIDDAENDAEGTDTSGGGNDAPAATQAPATGAPVFIVNGKRVDPNGKPVEG